MRRSEKAELQRWLCVEFSFFREAIRCSRWTQWGDGEGCSPRTMSHTLNGLSAPSPSFSSYFFAVGARIAVWRKIFDGVDAWKIASFVAKKASTKKSLNFFRCECFPRALLFSKLAWLTFAWCDSKNHPKQPWKRSSMILLDHCLLGYFFSLINLKLIALDSFAALSVLGSFESRKCHTKKICQLGEKERQINHNFVANDIVHDSRKQQEECLLP